MLNPRQAPAVILFFVHDDTEVIRFELDGVQLRIELLDAPSILNAVVLFPQLFDFGLDGPRIGLGVCDSVQLVQPSEHLAIGQGDDLVVPTRLGDGQRQLPLRFAKSAAMQLIYVLLTN